MRIAADAKTHIMHYNTCFPDARSNLNQINNDFLPAHLLLQTVEWNAKPLYSELEDWLNVSSQTHQ